MIRQVHRDIVNLVEGVPFGHDYERRRGDTTVEKDPNMTKINWRDISYSRLSASESSENTNAESIKRELTAALQSEDFRIELLNAALRN